MTITISTIINTRPIYGFYIFRDKKGKKIVLGVSYGKKGKGLVI